MTENDITYLPLQKSRQKFRMYEILVKLAIVQKPYECIYLMKGNKKF